MSQSQQMTPLTEKDLSYMKDAIYWETIACKKAYQYAHQTLEPDCRQLMFQVAEQHQKNMEAIVQHMGMHVQQSVQSAVSGAQPMTTHTM
ncbi:MAG TPA: hypothetical protein VD973_03995 [Symbiobacteriaceae bacterium]|nr:hypothetical protein [Symbiobacteriaceae bacterium]